MSNRKTLNERIVAAQLEKEQAEVRIKSLLKEQKAAERKARNHRLCERGGKVEKLLPGLAQINDEQFQIFMAKCLDTRYTRNILAELVPPEPEQADGGTSTEQIVGTPTIAPSNAAAHTESNPAPKPTQTAKPQGVADGSKTGDPARVAS
jgi:hypothetical protein